MKFLNVIILFLFVTFQAYSQEEIDTIKIMFTDILSDYENNDYSVALKKIENVIHYENSDSSIIGFSYFWKAKIFSEIGLLDSSIIFAKKADNFSNPVYRFNSFYFKDDLDSILDKRNNGALENIDWILCLILLCFGLTIFSGRLFFSNRKLKAELWESKLKIDGLQNTDTKALYIMSLLNSTIHLNAQKIHLKDVIFAQKDSKKRNTVKLYLKDLQPFSVYTSISQLELLLPFPLFFKSNQSTIINTKEIQSLDELTERFRMSNECKVEISSTNLKMARKIVDDNAL